MSDKISNTIALHQQTINEIEEIKERVKESETEKIRFRVETKHWYGFSEPSLMKRKHNLNLSKYTMQVILEEAIKKERQRIDILIDKEIEERSRNERDKV